MTVAVTFCALALSSCSAAPESSSSAWWRALSQEEGDVPIPTDAALTKCVDDDDVTFLARLLFGEARGELWEGKVAVAHVVKNRRESKGRWPNSIKGVGLQKWQFSCFGDGGHLAAVLDPQKADPAAWGACLAVASDVLCGRAGDPTGIAPNHYVTEALFQSPACPAWAKAPGVPQKVLGHHRFLRL